MRHFLLFLITYIIVFLLYYLLLIRKNILGKFSKKKKEKIKPMEVTLLESKYDIDLEKINYNGFLLVISAVSALDITIIVTMMSIVSGYLGQFLVLIAIFPIILISYNFIGRLYEYLSNKERNVKKKGKKKND